MILRQPRNAPVRPSSLLTRRKFLTASTSAAALTIARPYISRANDRPLITHGIQSGDVGTDGGVIWARTDRPARMRVEIATTESFRDVRQGVFVDALPQSDFTAKALLEDLPPGQDIFYRVRFQDHSQPTILSEPRSAASAARRRTAARSPSSGVATSPGRAGVSTWNAAACVASRPCAGAGLISSCIPVIPSMPIIHCKPR